MRPRVRSFAFAAALAAAATIPLEVVAADDAKPDSATSAAKATEAKKAVTKLTPEGRATLRPARKRPMFPGPALEVLGGPLLAAEEAYANRAYPAADIPMTLTLNAQAAFDDIKGRGVGRGKNVPGQWTLIGPSTANFPAILTFSGADYTTSGRITALAIAPSCGPGKCTLWVAAAGGGVWRTDNALSGQGASWTFVSGSFTSNAIGTLTYHDGVLYAGTGEPNASGDSEAGRGIYRSTDGGNTWTHLASQVTALTTPGNGTYTGDAFESRSISSIVVDPANANILYVSSTRGVRGVASVTGGATTTPPPPRPPFGLFKSTDGGATFSFVWDGNATIRGVNHVELDPSNSNIVYAAAFQQGVWRSTNGGTTFTQILAPIAPTLNTDRAEFAATKLPNGKTRMYVGDGAQGTPAARFYRTDDASGAAVFTNLTTAQNQNYCTGQCWYDNYVISPAGHPDIVYLGGSYQYGEFGAVSNSRGILLSIDGGATFTDVSWDASSATTPNGLHPDHHALVTHPDNPYLFFSGSDGGLMRSSGDFTDASGQCAARGLSGANLTLCQQLLSRIPSHLFSLNKGLSTLQFQSFSVASDDPRHLQGGTQDNGTFETTGSAVVWPQIIYGDGGQSGFSATNSVLRFNTFTGQANDVNFQNGEPTKWVIATGPIVSSPESSAFYPPIIADPHPSNAKTIYQGSFSVWRTQNWGGDQAYLEANCPEFTTSAAAPNCGDFVQIGPAGATSLTAAALGNRSGGTMAAIARTTADVGTLWAATSAGRVFISKNANAAATAVTFKRLDSLGAASPGRFVSGIVIDAKNPNHAWISYGGYNFNTPAQPGHVFSVVYDPNANTATWTSLDGITLGDLPANAVAFDDVTGDLYAGSDFGVMRLPNGTTTWVLGGTGLPVVEVAGLTIVPSARKLYAATHGRSGWALTLP
ncbi:MAG TPA: exo-alpha-sialidase [Casimicrobiaceae bacterium]